MTPRDVPAKRRHRADARILAALAAGATIDEAARLSGVSPSTVDRRLRDADFRTELNRQREVSLDRAADALAGVASKAVAALASMLDDPEASASARVSAARAILDSVSRADGGLTLRSLAVETPGLDRRSVPVRAKELCDKLEEFQAEQRRLEEVSTPRPELRKRLERHEEEVARYRRILETRSDAWMDWATYGGPGGQAGYPANDATD